VNDYDVNKVVAAGAAALDDRRPGWEREIDLGTLELDDSCRCVLGQLYGHFTSGCLAMTGTSWMNDWALMHGFDITAAMFKEEGQSLYVALDEAWISLIKTRFDNGALSDAA
jgi:hypothetical protein